MNNIIQASTREPQAPERSAAFPGIMPSVGWVALYFALQFVVTGMIIAGVVAAQKIADPTLKIDAAVVTDNPVLIIWGLVASATVQLGLMWLYLRKADRAQIIGLTHFGRLSIGRALAVAIGALVLATVFNALYANYVIAGQPMQDAMAKLLASIPRTPVNIALGIVAIAVVAPLIEELLFRGLLQNALMHHVPAWAAIVLSAFAFSVVHMQLLAMPALMALGAAFGYIYYKTGSLRMTIILHMVNNMLALALTQMV